ENLGAEHHVVKRVLAGKAPAARAAELVAGTKLFDPAERKRLVEGGFKAVEASQDEMIRLALLIDGEARNLRQRYETEIEEVEGHDCAAIDRLRSAGLARGAARDAPFTRRLAFGVIKGSRADGAALPIATTFGGAFERSERQGGREPFALPKR